MEVKIHRELRDLMPARTEQEDRELRESIRRYGVREPVTVAEIANEHVIVDGHNRHRIATEENVEYETREFEFVTLDAVRDAETRAREKLEIARQDLEHQRKNKSSGADEARDHAEERISELEEQVETLANTLEERIIRAKLDEVKLYMIRDALARRNVTPTDKVILTRAAKEIVYKRDAEEAKRAGQDRGRDTRYGHGSIDPEPTESDKRVRKQIAADSGVSEGTTTRVMFVEDVANGKRDDFADRRELAAKQLAGMRAGEVAPSAAEKAIREGKTDTESRKPTAAVPEDNVCKWLDDKRGWSPDAIATRYKVVGANGAKLADWLEELAAKLRESA